MIIFLTVTSRPPSPRSEPSLGHSDDLLAMAEAFKDDGLGRPQSAWNGLTPISPTPPFHRQDYAGRIGD